MTPVSLRKIPLLIINNKKATKMVEVALNRNFLCKEDMKLARELIKRNLQEFVNSRS
jgi:hypothetical protein